MLTARRFTLPLQALEPMDLDGDGVATLLLLNPTGGLLAGDRLETDIVLAPGSRVCLSTPSATRVYRSPGPVAVQRVTMDVGRGAALEWLPDHLIPSPGARLRQTTEIRLAADATLLYLDAWATGRAARGEAWGFDLLDSSLLVRDEAGPLLRERSILAGRPPRDGLGGTEGFAYVATFLAMRPAGLATQPDWEDLASALQEGCRRLAGRRSRRSDDTRSRWRARPAALPVGAHASRRGARAVGHVPATAARTSSRTAAKALGNAARRSGTH